MSLRIGCVKVVGTPGNKAAKKNKQFAVAPAQVSLTHTSHLSHMALILGSANCVFEDKARALALFKPDYIFCTNDFGVDYPEAFDHWCTMHPDKLAGWVRARRKAGRPDAKQLWIPQHRNPPKELTGLVRQSPSRGGSSGLLCCMVVLKILNCRAVLAGVPMKVGNAHYNSPKPWTDAVHYISAWRQSQRELDGRIKSMSGWTKELLGEPTPGWLYGSK